MEQVLEKFAKQSCKVNIIINFDGYTNENKTEHDPK